MCAVYGCGFEKIWGNLGLAHRSRRAHRFTDMRSPRSPFDPPSSFLSDSFRSTTRTFRRRPHSAMVPLLPSWQGRMLPYETGPPSPASPPPQPRAPSSATHAQADQGGQTAARRPVGEGKCGRACFREKSEDGWLQTLVWRSTSPAPPAAKAGEASRLSARGRHVRRPPQPHPSQRGAPISRHAPWKLTPIAPKCCQGCIGKRVEVWGRSMVWSVSLAASNPRAWRPIPVVSLATPSPAARREQVARGQGPKKATKATMDRGSRPSKHSVVRSPCQFLLLRHDNPWRRSRALICTRPSVGKHLTVSSNVSRPFFFRRPHTNARNPCHAKGCAPTQVAGEYRSTSDCKWLRGRRWCQSRDCRGRVEKTRQSSASAQSVFALLPRSLIESSSRASVEAWRLRKDL